ncbi:MAG: aminotransferase class V-fold PLP-dependent enzyme [Rhodospirillaceae bacterium]|jgi:cysteine desulfurase/selenocysteine lyase|nr:aminotransferase class V-fold PLP-dependent enzyme [Rhodospirillales bacterium]MBT3906741.1 aminotransferase class V-fold PLP-dependent enzyme [Rhodospirillaceae bacterium]MBT4703065.1 aminotransferase class V-fold PLP-dependent enzyme [Rhodospirillaceae bacterium]MBT5034232.1 aminotransferase class V-fold PLP-dependent enzyme [Rhodospirillaceae bacterium]MBT6218195.1 aminotransferase class V-fold PLP-dependent enzyme [Rhodospirillaceae bacterium]
MNKISLPSEKLSLKDAQALFLKDEATTYFSTCTRGLLPSPARAALDVHLEGLQSGLTDKDALFATVEDTRRAFAKLINSDANEVAFTKNVSEGLNMIAAAFDWQAGENAVVCLEMEHPNNVYPWLNQRKREDISVRSVPHREGHIDAELLIDAIDEKTRLVTMPTVTFSPGFRADVAAVGKICRERGIFLLVDAVQSLGILDTDVMALGVDGLAVSTQKGLCGLYGMGFLYCRAEWAERLTPAYLARFGVDLGGGAHEAAFGAEDYRLMPAAGRFDLGNYNYPGVVVAEKTLDILNRVGTQTIETHVGGLAARLIDGLLGLGLPVPGGPAGPQTASIVCIGNLGAEGHDTAEDPMISRLSDHLSQGGFIHTIRRGMIRLALHLYNDEDDVDRLLAHARKLT